MRALEGSWEGRGVGELWAAKGLLSRGGWKWLVVIVEGVVSALGVSSAGEGEQVTDRQGVAVEDLFAVVGSSWL